MELKAWFGSNMGAKLPPELDLPVVRAVLPYDVQVEALDRHVGTVFAREALKDASGVSQMDAKTQVTRLNGVSVLDAAQYPLEANVALALLKEPGGENDRKLCERRRGRLAQPAWRCDACRGAGRARRRQCDECVWRRVAIVGPRRTEPAAPSPASDRALRGGRAERCARRELQARSAAKACSGGASCWPPSPTRVHRTMSTACARGRALGVRGYLERLDATPVADARARCHHHDAGLGPLMRKRSPPDGGRACRRDAACSAR